MEPSLGRGLFVGLVLLIAIIMFVLLTRSIRNGRTWASFGMMLATTAGVVLITWSLMQHGRPSLGSLTFRNISYAAVLGDLFVLTTCAAASAIGWRVNKNEISDFWRSGWWAGSSFAIGLTLGIASQISGGLANSNSSVLEEQLHDSAVAWAHNLGVIPVVAGALVCTVLPLLLTNATGSWSIFAVVCVFVWMGLFFVDSYRTGLGITNPWHFNPSWLDTVMDWGRWMPLPS